MIFLRMHKDFLSYSVAFLGFHKLIHFIAILLILSFSYSLQINAQEKNFTVVLDAGHGGHDSGNRGNGYYEKNIALNIALKIGKKLDKEKNLNVIYTRKKDVFVDLIERANIANKANADLFVSIHCDAFSSPKVYGAGTFVLGLHENERNFKVAQKENSVIFLEKDFEKNYEGFDPNNPESVISLILMQETYLDQSISAANTIQKSFVKNLNRKDRTVKQAGFIVLKYTYMPSVLVETGFLTNVSEGYYLNSSKGQSNMADAIAKAIINYRNDRNASFQNNKILSESNSENSNKKLKVELKFKVQIAAGSKKLNLRSYNFNGLENITRSKSGNLYRYYYGETNNYKKASMLLNEAKLKGFKNSFIVAFDGEKKISISEALQYLK